MTIAPAKEEDSGCLQIVGMVLAAVFWVLIVFALLLHVSDAKTLGVLWSLFSLAMLVLFIGDLRDGMTRGWFDMFSLMSFLAIIVGADSAYNSFRYGFPGILNALWVAPAALIALAVIAHKS